MVLTKPVLLNTPVKRNISLLEVSYNYTPYMCQAQLYIYLFVKFNSKPRGQFIFRYSTEKGHKTIPFKCWYFHLPNKFVLFSDYISVNLIIDIWPTM